MRLNFVNLGYDKKIAYFINDDVKNSLKNE